MPKLLTIRKGDLVLEFTEELKSYNFFEVKEFKEGRVIARQFWPELIPHIDITERKVELVDDPRHAFFLGIIAAHRDFQKRERGLQEIMSEENPLFHKQYVESVGDARLQWSDEILSLMFNNLKIQPVRKDD